MRIATLLFLISGIAAIAQEPSKSGNDPLKKDDQAIIGTWDVVGMADEAGKVMAKQYEGWYWVIAEGKLTMFRGKEDDKGVLYQFILNPTSTPKGIDLEFKASEKLIFAGIYSLEGDTLKVCIATTKLDSKVAPRPSEFKPAQAGNLFMLQRRK